MIFEVRSPTDRWTRIHTKVAEYLNAGVSIVCVLDEQTAAAHVFDPEESPRILSGNEALNFPGVLPDFSAPVADFFR